MRLPVESLHCSLTESRLLSDTNISSFATLCEAITKLHKTYRLPHIVVTSVQFERSPSISIVGSTIRTDGSPRLFKVDVPAIDCHFAGTGDMFAALTVVRLRQAITENGLTGKKSWISPDDVDAVNLPLAQAIEEVLSSMQVVLEKTKKARDEALEGMGGPLGTLEKEKDSEKRLHLRRTKAAEVRLVRNLDDLKERRVTYQAQPLEAGDEHTKGKAARS